jgi:hypothetical protein
MHRKLLRVGRRGKGEEKCHICVAENIEIATPHFVKVECELDCVLDAIFGSDFCMNKCVQMEHIFLPQRKTSNCFWAILLLK